MNTLRSPQCQTVKSPDTEVLLQKYTSSIISRNDLHPERKTIDSPSDHCSRSRELNSKVRRNRNRNRKLQTSKAPLKSQAQGTSLFTSATSQLCKQMDSAP